jgi:predicted ATPase/class 3 adenylate cyclase
MWLCEHARVGDREPGAGRVALPSGDVTFLFTDLEGSTALLRRMGEAAYQAVLADVRRIQLDAASAQDGALVHTEGDSCFFAFRTAAGALLASGEIQRSLRERERATGIAARLRMGLHRGHDVQPVDDDYATLAVHQAARVANAAWGGQVLFTDAVASAEPTSSRPLGLYIVRDFDGPVMIWTLIGEEGARRPRMPHAIPVGVGSAPSYRTGFVGRADDLRRLVKTISEGRLVTLVGPGGAGKTRLAVETVAQLDGFAARWFIDLVPARTGADIIASVRSALGDLGSGVDTEDPLRAIAELLGSHRGLVVLDNCEHVLDVAAAFTDELLGACPSVSVLCTSREPLALPDELVVSVSGLPLPNGTDPAAVAASESGQLFAERAARVGELVLDNTTAAAVSAICAALDGLPLALELIAAATRTYSAADLVSVLHDELRPGHSDSMTVARGRPARHVTLRAVIDWSVRDLDDQARLALAALAVPEAPIVARLAFAALRGVGLEHAEAEAVIGELIRRSLVAAQPGTDGALRLYETVRAYARQLPALEPFRADVGESLAADCIDAAGDLTISAVSRPFPAGHAATVTMLLSEEALTPLSRQRLTLAGLPLLFSRSTADAARRLRDALALGNHDDAVTALLYRGLASYHWTRSEIDAGKTHALTAAEHARRSGDATVINAAEVTMAQLLLRGGRTAEVDELTRGALARPEVQADPRLIFSWLSVRSAALAELDRRDEAVPMLRDALEKVDGDRAVTLRMNLANALAPLGQSREAIQHAFMVWDSPSATTVIKLMVSDIISYALFTEHPSSEALALQIWGHDTYLAFEHGMYAGDRQKYQALLRRAAEMLSGEDQEAARRLADSLDLASGLDLSERLGRALLAELDAAATHA